ncbi:hypothetical protein Emed_002942 [Eimeria media]
MVSLKLTCLAGVCLASLTRTHGSEANYDNFSGSRVSCLDELNHYRVAAGFSSFTESDILTSQEKNEVPSTKETNSKLDSNFLNYACNSLQSKSAALSTDRATFAVHSQSGTNADCSAAVEYWKGAIANFDSLPPEYQESTTPYNSSKNVSFVALFNPKNNAAVDCAYVTCQKTTTQPDSDTAGNPSEEQTQPSGPEDPKEPPSTPAAPPASPSDTSPSTNGGGVETEKENLGDKEGVQENEGRDTPQVRRLSARSVRTGDTVVESTQLLVCATTPAALKAEERPFT